MDAGTKLQVGGLPDRTDLVVWGFPVAEGAVMSVDCVDCGGPDVYSFDRRSNQAVKVAGGVVAPGLDGEWIKEYVTETQCVVSKIGLDGAMLMSGKPIECGFNIVEEVPLGLVVWMEDFGADTGAVLAVDDLREIHRGGIIHAVA